VTCGLRKRFLPSFPCWLLSIFRALSLCVLSTSVIASNATKCAVFLAINNQKSSFFAISCGVLWSLRNEILAGETVNLRLRSGQIFNLQTDGAVHQNNSPWVNSDFGFSGFFSFLGGSSWAIPRYSFGSDSFAFERLRIRPSKYPIPSMILENTGIARIPRQKTPTYCQLISGKCIAVIWK